MTNNVEVVLTGIHTGAYGEDKDYVEIYVPESVKKIDLFLVTL